MTNPPDVYDHSLVESAIDAVERHYAGLMISAVPSGDGRFAAISFSNPAGDSSKFYGPQTDLVLEAARLWHDHLRSSEGGLFDTDDEQAEEDLQTIRDNVASLAAPGVVPTITETKTVYRVVVSVDGDMKDDDYFHPYDRRKDAFIFAAALDPETYDEVDVVEDQIPTYVSSIGPMIDNDDVDVDF